MAKETTVARTPEDLQRRYRFKNIELTKQELDSFLNNLVFDSSLSSTSTNPVQNKVITLALANKVTTVSGKGLSANDYTDSDKSKVSVLPLITQSDVDRWNTQSGGWTPPVGYIWTSGDSANPSTLFTGTTWQQVECKDVVASGDVTTSSLINISYGKYKVYANGDFEAWGYLVSTNIPAASVVSTVITLPFVSTGASTICGLAYGEGAWSFCSGMAYGGTNSSSFTISMGNTASTQVSNANISFHIKGNLSLSDNNIDTHYSWQRTA